MFTTGLIMDNLNFLTMNTRGLGDKFKRKQIFNWLQQKSENIFLLQETHSTIESQKKWYAEWGGDIIFNHGKSNARGTAILFKNTVDVKIHELEKDNDGRYIIIDCTINNIHLTVANIYAPNDDNAEFFLNIINIIENFPNDHRIVGGDFNLVLDLQLDKIGGSFKTHTKSQKTILSWIEETNLVDAWRHKNPNLKKFTWCRKNPNFVGCRLDFFLISFGLLGFIKNTNIHPGLKTDHSAVSIHLISDHNIRGRGYWKLNCSLLLEAEYVELIKQCITDTVELNNNNDTNAQLLWDTIKMNVRGYTIKYATSKKKSKSLLISSLEQKISKLEDKFIETNDNSILNKIDQHKKDLENEFKYLTQGNIIRSRTKWYEEGEKSSKYFLNLEKRNFNNKRISMLRLEDNSLITTDQDILKEEKNFYAKLYDKKIQNYTSSINFFESSDANYLTQEDKDKYNEQITEEEIFKAIEDTDNDKSPGTDGLPIEFYKTFWHDIKKYFIASMELSYNIGELGISQRQGIISLLPKKEKDPTLLKNWRPLSLLNQDYKIIAKVIATRIKNVLPKLIHHDQTGFLSGRYIGENINRILNIIDYAETNNLKAILVFVDFEKAFDSIDWAFIHQALEHFNFGNVIIRWVKTLYSNISAIVQNNGWLSETFKLHRGVRQGCPLSPYLFTICVELLAMQIRNNNNIKGININEEELKISQYADDTSLSLMYSEKSLEETLDIFEQFEYVSGLKMNLDKTEILRIGAIKYSDEKLLPKINIKWTKQPVRVLGILVSADHKETLEINFNPKLGKVKQILRIWSQRNLSLLGKITLIKTFAISQLVYQLSILPSPSKTYISELNKILYNFIWDGKPDKIKRSVMIAPIDKGGLNMIDITIQDKSLKIAWIKRLLDNSQANWKLLVYNQLPNVGEYIWKCNFNREDVNKCFPNLYNHFWIDVLKSWADYNYHAPNNCTDILNQNIWFNSHIKINGQLLFYSNWYRAGIKHVADLFNSEGEFISLNAFILRYNITIDFLNWHAIKKAIPADWVSTINNEIGNKEHITRHYKVDELKFAKKGSKLVYSKLMTFEYLIPIKSFNKWSNELNTQDLDEDFWLDACQNIKLNSISSSHRTFQIRYYNRILATKEKLYKMGIIENNKCSFCNDKIETLAHMFWECEIIQSFWTKIITWIFSVTDIKIVFKSHEILFHCPLKDPLPYNFVFSLAREHIYFCRNKEKIPNLFNFVNFLNITKQMEYSIATKNNTLTKFYKKWGLLVS